MKTSAVNFSTLTAFALGWAIIYVDRISLYPLLESIRLDWQLSFGAVGLVATVYFASYVLFQIPAGLLGVKLGLKTLVIPTTLLSGVALALIGLAANSYLMLLVLIALVGVGAGTYYSAAYGITVSATPARSRGFNAALVTAGMGAGSLLGFVVAVPLSEGFGTWKAAFLVLALPTLTIGVAFKFWIPAQGSEKAAVRYALKAVSDRRLLLLDLALFLANYGRWVMYVWSPTFFIREQGVDPTLAGFYTGIVAAVAIPADIANSRLSDRYGRKRMLLFLLPMNAVSIFVFAYVPSVALKVGALVLYGATGSSMPIAVSWVGDILAGASIPVGAAMGFFNFAGMLSSIVAPVFTGVLVDLTGTLVAGYYFGAVVTASAVLVVLLTRPSHMPGSNRRAKRAG